MPANSFYGNAKFSVVDVKDTPPEYNLASNFLSHIIVSTLVTYPYYGVAFGVEPNQ